MVFNSLTFALFFILVFTVYFSLRRNFVWQNRFLLVASFVFYGWWDGRFLILMMFTITVDFFVGKKIQSSNDAKIRKQFMLLSVVSNLAILGFFKYFGFFSESFVDMARLFGYEIDPFLLHVVLPVGISFYTFQSMSYVIDIYKGRLEPVKKLLDYAAYVSLFPQLVAGPIERATHLVPQILSPRKLTADNFYSGSYLILWGLFKKIYVADNLAKIAEPVFSGNTEYSGAMVLIGTYAFAFQIYCDFSGYTDIARGTARCMGFDLMKNFNFPYISSTPSEFWRRWHISLSTWLRDYLYIGLGGNRKGDRRTQINLMATMLLGGLWHGAAWNFVIWGGFHGLLLVIYRYLSPLGAVIKGRVSQLVTKGVAIVLFFHLTCYGWLIFRASSAGQIRDMSLTLLEGVNLHELFSNLPRLGFYVAPLLLVEFTQLLFKGQNFVFKLPILPRALFYVALVYGIFVFGNLGATEFIYFQF